MRNPFSVLRFFLLLGFMSCQAQEGDVADEALLSTFQRDNSVYVCLTKPSGLKEMRAELNPFIQGVDATKGESFPAIAKAIYEAFPCPFSPVRPELARASKNQLIGRWLFTEKSIRLRHGPKSPAWRQNPGMPPVKCEAVVFQESGAYRVAQVLGGAACPDEKMAVHMESLPQVSSWSVRQDQKIVITRTDVPSRIEEWDYFFVQAPFYFAGIEFSTGDLLAYLRREPGNEINAATVFLHLRPLK